MADLYRLSRVTERGDRTLELSVPAMHCGGCIRKIEDLLIAQPEVMDARANLTTRRVTVRWNPAQTPSFIEVLSKAGFASIAVDAQPEQDDQDMQTLIRSLAVAGFGTANIMLFSVSVWAGVDSDIRTIFHLLSGLIALVVLSYSGRIFFQSACQALRGGSTNMDVPISVGILLAFMMGIYDIATGGEHVYFDASVTLVFFLLIGRTLDHTMRSRVRSAVSGMANLIPQEVMRQNAAGQFTYALLNDIRPGDALSIRPNERIAVDSRVQQGRSDVDRSLVTGEALPYAVEPGSFVAAGTQNLTHPLVVTAVSDAQNSFLSEVLRAMQAAENGRLRYRRLADRLSRWYAPFVHTAALLGFLLWFASGADIHQSLSIAVAVLIITCPCALGLAVPMVQVIAARILFERGVLIKDGSALERLAQVDVVVFDKTGTLTSGQPEILNAVGGNDWHHRIAGSMAQHSNHPYSRSIAARSPIGSPIVFDELEDLPGRGVQARLGEYRYRLGSSPWADPGTTERDNGGVVLADRDGPLIQYTFEDPVRADAADTITQLRNEGVDIELVSGDSTRRVQTVANSLEISNWQANARPTDKVARFDQLKNEGHRAMMVGDGLNDVPALAAAFVSMAPESAAELGRSACDIVYLRGRLDAIPFAIQVAQSADKLVRQNMGLALTYNAVALPLAIAGMVTPLIAAVAMSASSAIVVINAFRLHRQSNKNTLRRSPDNTQHIQSRELNPL